MSSLLVTGSTRGLGFELVSQFLALPAATIATVFVTGRSNEAPAHVQKVIKTSDGRAHYVSLDVSSESSVAQAVRKVEAQLSGQGLDMIVNNAAIMLHEGPPTQIKTTDMEQTFSANVSSVQRVVTAFLPLLEKGKQKKIMNVTSTMGSIGLAKNFFRSDAQSYKISKAALNMLFSLWALELGPQGFTVFGISPGWLRTDLGGSYADLEVSQGASQVVKILLEAAPDKDNGAFRDIYVEGHPTYPGTNPSW